MGKTREKTGISDGKKSKVLIIIALLLAVVLIAAVVIVILVLNSKDEKAEKNSHKAAAEKYASSLYNKERFGDLQEVQMSDEVFEAYRNSDDFETDETNYIAMVENLDKENMSFDIKSVEKGDELSEKMLFGAEVYFREQAETYDVDLSGISVTEGYRYSIELDVISGENKTSTKLEPYIVNIKDSGWKLITGSLTDLEEYADEGGYKE